LEKREVASRAALPDAVADVLEQRKMTAIAILDASSEVRESVYFCRYYARMA
jgi:delta 1-pyrroline-5-carboxylate dehydrogenase